jgi:hypothetical protein
MSADVTEDGTEQLLPTVTGFAARQAISALRKHNIATGPLLQRAGLSEYFVATGDDATTEGSSDDDKEHTKNARPSTEEKHAKGRSRVGRDRPGGEKGDSRRPYRR